MLKELKTEANVLRVEERIAKLKGKNKKQWDLCMARGIWFKNVRQNLIPLATAYFAWLQNRHFDTDEEDEEMLSPQTKIKRRKQSIWDDREEAPKVILCHDEWWVVNVGLACIFVLVRRTRSLCWKLENKAVSISLQKSVDCIVPPTAVDRNVRYWLFQQNYRRSCAPNGCQEPGKRDNLKNLGEWYDALA